MRTYKFENEEKITTNEVFCNMCGNRIEKDCHGYFFDYIHVEKLWGYNSSKDGSRHEFDICEKCYDKLTENFKIKL